MPRQKKLKDQTDKPKRPYVWVEQKEVISAMRARFRKYPPYKEVLQRCRVEWFHQCKNGNKRLRVSFKCEKCSVLSPRKTFKVDHIDPVVDPTTGFKDYVVYAKRLYCAIANLQGLCKPCHDAKTKCEKKIRDKARREAKNNVA